MRVNHDNDRRYRKPLAWAKAKKAMRNQFCIEELMEQMERLAGGGSARFLMATALHSFVTASEEERDKRICAFDEYFSVRLQFERRNRPAAAVRRELFAEMRTR